MKKDILKKKIIYISNHRGTKEMDILLSNFVKKYINSLNERELNDLEKLLNIDDEILYNWYFRDKLNQAIPNNDLTKKLRDFKL